MAKHCAYSYAFDTSPYFSIYSSIQIGLESHPRASGVVVGSSISYGGWCRDVRRPQTPALCRGLQHQHRGHEGGDAPREVREDLDLASHRGSRRRLPPTQKLKTKMANPSFWSHLFHHFSAMNLPIPYIYHIILGKRRLNNTESVAFTI